MGRNIIWIALLVVGCANTTPPIDVALIPNDCANRTAIERWLESQTKLNKPFNWSQAEYDQYRSQIKARMWNLRYHCQPR